MILFGYLLICEGDLLGSIPSSIQFSPTPLEKFLIAESWQILGGSRSPATLPLPKKIR
jgi:hypothetical protein